jgi:FtsH-binding integral membrane protein
MVIPILLNFLLKRLSNSAAYSLFYCYSIFTGTFFAPILLSYDMGKISIAFILTGLGFVYAVSQGRTRDFDVNDRRTLLFFSFTLFGIGFINLFLRLTILELASCALGIPLCIGLTSYLVSQVNKFSIYRGPDMDRLSILMSLMLLQNLVSLFLYILRMLEIVSGGRKGRN